MRDIKYALRRLLHNPGFSLVVVLTLALGIGANTAIFSIVNGVLLRPLPYHEPDRLVTMNHYYPNLDGLEAGFAVPTYRDVRERMTIFDAFAVGQGWSANLTGIGQPERLMASKTTWQFFKVFGVQPLLGRTFVEGEDHAGREKVVVLGHGFWQRRFGGDKGIVGRKILLDGEPYDVIGVMPVGFYSFFNRTIDLWAPVVFQPEQFGDNRRTNEFLVAAGRLRAGMTVEQAKRDVTAFADGLKKDYPDAYARQWTIIANSMNEISTRRIKTALLVLAGAVGMVLLIACANIANLLLARAASRAREVAVRAAVGATRADLIRQLLAESVLLSLVGAVVGLAIAYGAVQGLVATVPVDVLRVEAIQIDGVVLLFTLGIAVITGLLFGIAPAIHASRTDLHDALKDGARTAGERGGHLLRRILVVSEVALALMLLVCAGLLIRSFARLQGVTPGFDPENVITVSVSLPRAKYDTPDSRAAFFETLRQRLAALPGVEGVGGTSNIPFGGNWSTGSFSVEGYQQPEGQPGPWGDQRLVTPGYFETMKIKLLKGRLLTPADRPGAPRVVVVDDEMVKRYWPNSDPIGKRITYGDTAAPDVEWITVVGVVEHTAHEGLDAERRVQLYGTASEPADPAADLCAEVGVRPDRARVQRPADCARHRSRPAHRAGADDGSDDGRGAGPAEADDVPARHVCRPRRHARCHRHLRRDVFRRDPPVAGAWCQNGAWRRARLRARPGDAAGARHGAHRRRARPRAGADCHARARSAAATVSRAPIRRPSPSWRLC